MRPSAPSAFPVITKCAVSFIILYIYISILSLWMIENITSCCLCLITITQFQRNGNHWQCCDQVCGGVHLKDSQVVDVKPGWSLARKKSFKGQAFNAIIVQLHFGMNKKKYIPYLCISGSWRSLMLTSPTFSSLGCSSSSTAAWWAPFSSLNDVLEWKV